MDEDHGRWKPSQQWRPPSNGIYKLNFDGAVNTVAKKGGIRIIIRKCWRCGNGPYTSNKPEFMCPFMLEASAAICALQLAQQIGFLKVEIEGDALGVIRKLQRIGEDITNWHFS